MSPSSRDALRRLRRTLARSDRGQELIELAIVLPVVLFLLLGTIELGYAFTVAHAMAGLSREGASLASRGATLTEVAQVVIDNGGDINMTARGGVVASRVVVQGSTPTVTDQFSRGSVGASQMGPLGSPAAALQSISGLQDGRVLYTVEVFYAYQPITPLSGVLGRILPSSLYEAAVF
ncbi:MAG: TadE/TadG family type IV pilus assembly protein [Gemmatimonadota bacterium]